LITGFCFIIIFDDKLPTGVLPAILGWFLLLRLMLFNWDTYNEIFRS
jgi:hypothetical protein